MRGTAYYCTVEELQKRGRDDIPEQFRSNTHLIYSSPATLAFNSPGAEGFGVKRAGLAIPDSIMLIVAPGCCGRNTSMISSMPQYEDRFFYLTMDETDIVTGRHLKKVPKAVQEICDSLEKKPSVVMICITCVDALLGTDMERICKKIRRKDRTSGQTVLYVCADKRRTEAADGACASVLIFFIGTKEEKRKCRESAGILLTTYG